MGESKSVFEPLDGAKLSRFHVRTILIAGLGFFTDAYDLFIIGVIAALFLFYTPFAIPAKLLTFHIAGKTGSITGIELISASAIFGAFVGPFVFGRLGDLLGRKRIYGLEMLLLAAGALLSGLAWSFASLVIFRFILGLGIGGDYPMSATIMSEYSSVKSRGRLVGTVFAMQGFGILAGIALAIGLLALYPSQLGIMWRVLLAAGAVPALSVYYYRRKMPETPRYTYTVAGNLNETKSTIKSLTGKNVEANGEGVIGKRKYGEMARKYLPVIIGTAVTWFFFDISFYGTSIYTATLFSDLSLTYAPHMSNVAHLLTGEEYTAIVDLIFTIPGYWIAVALIDKAGRKTLQLAGFGAMAVLFAVLGLYPGIISLGLPFVVIYGLTFLFGNIGPNTTTFVLPTELFPTPFRASGHGIAAGSGKLGAAISTLFFATIVLIVHDAGMMLLLSAVALLGVLFTAVFIRETAGETLEMTSRETAIAAKE